MNTFIHFIDLLRAELDSASGAELIVDEPASSVGIRTATVSADDGYLIEVEWSRHRGFGLVAGPALEFGSGVHELYGSAETAAARVLELIESRAATSASAPVALGDLRKLRGALQKDVAKRLGISKSALAQAEGAQSVQVMQLATLKKVVESLGGELVITARFPEGPERRIAVD